MRTLISPELVWTSYNVAVSLCHVLRNVTSLSLSRISSFKRSLELLTGVSTCLYDLSITWTLKYKIRRKSQTDFSIFLGGEQSQEYLNFMAGWRNVNSKKNINKRKSPFWRLWNKNNVVYIGCLPAGWKDTAPREYCPSENLGISFIVILIRLWIILSLALVNNLTNSQLYYPCHNPFSATASLCLSVCLSLSFSLSLSLSLC